MHSQKSFQLEPSTQGQLFLVPTPIGNLEDMTFRAIDVLKNVDIILAEDTRQTGKLLHHFSIPTKMRSFHEHSDQEQVDYWIETLKAGQSLALVSDAGMPLINDPGHPLVQKALRAQLSVISLPGANAALTALVASGLPANQFTYYGFFPRNKKDQSQLLDQIGSRDETAVFYESPYRIKKSLGSVLEVLGPDCQVVVARELTKKFEEYLRGKVRDIYEHLQTHTLKGEIVFLIEGGSLSGKSAQTSRVDQTLSLKEQVEQLVESDQLSSKQAIKEVAQLNQLRKQIVYAAYHDID